MYPQVTSIIERNTLLVMIGDTLAGVLGGATVMWKMNRKRGKGVPIQGRFWRFPQGNLMVQVSLKRMGSLVGGGEE